MGEASLPPSQSRKASVIPIAEQRHRALLPRVPTQARPANGLLADTLGRPLRDLRISVTDRCNFRCSYCMPKEVFGRDYAFLPQTSLLSFEEITRLARVFASHGVKKIRLTGGEPTLRKHLETLVGMLAELRNADGEPLDLTLTTNGSLLTKKARALADAGLKRITVSLDALDDAIFRRMNDVEFPVADVLAGIDAALAAGLSPVKVNMVVKRGTNDGEILPMARWFREHYGGAVVLRFIEYMDVGETNGWRMDHVLPSRELIERIGSVYPLQPIGAHGRRRNGRALALCGRRRRDRRHLQRHASLLPRLQPRAAFDGRQALPVPVRDAGARPAALVARGRCERRADRRRAGRHLDASQRPLLRVAQRGCRADLGAQGRDALHRRMK